MKLAVSGHRAGTFDWIKVDRDLRAYLSSQKESLECVYVGMALGFDLMVLRACLDLGIPVVGCIPFPGHHNRWPDNPLQEYKKLYQRMIASGGQSVLVSNDTPSNRFGAANLLHARNRYMIDHSDHLLVCYDNRGRGGTFSAICHAEKKNVSVYNLLGGKKEMNQSIELYCDGACNPEGAGVGMYVPGVGTWSWGLGSVTNNVAEITSVTYCIMYAQKNYVGQEVTIYCDSKLAVEFANARWKAKEAHLKPLVVTLQKLMSQSPNICVEWTRGHVDTHGNERADEAAKVGRSLAKNTKIITKE